MFASARIFVAAALGTLAAAPASAALLQPDTYDTSSEFSSNYLGQFTIDGSGLPVNFTYTDSHADYATGNHWTTDGTAPTEEWIHWFFDNPVELFNIVLWTHRSNIISANSGYEPVLFDLTFFDASGSVLMFGDDIALAPNVSTGQVFGGAPIPDVSSVLFEVEATESSPSYTGLAEVAFNDATAPVFSDVPLPAAAPLLLLGLGGLAALRRRG